MSEPNSHLLTDKEIVCLSGIANGKTTAKLACELGLSERTINFHIGNVMRKLNANNRPHAVSLAILLGAI